MPTESELTARQEVLAEDIDSADILGVVMTLCDYFDIDPIETVRSFIPTDPPAVEGFGIGGDVRLVRDMIEQSQSNFNLACTRMVEWFELDDQIAEMGMQT